MAKAELINLEKELKKRVAFNKLANNSNNMLFNDYFFQKNGKMHDADSVFYDPYFVSDNAFNGIRTISRVQYGGIHCRTLRAVANKAWIINVCINHVTKKAKPFFKSVTDRNSRGFIIHKKDEDLTKGIKEDKERDRIKDFILNCGDYEDSDRDDFVKYAVKLLRDSLTIDQMATEIQYNNKGQPCAFFAVDGATIERVIADDKAKTDFRYLQIVDGMPAAGYTTDTMIFDFENPRTDIHHSMYGYSYVEQAVDLITSVINTFTYNAGNFTENRLPKGMLLINGDANDERVAEMEDYIAEIMSGGPVNQWRIPILPSGGKDNSIEWKPLSGTNREMEFQGWLDYLTSGVVAMFGCSMDELGIQSQKSQTMFENGGKDRITASKSLILGDLLTFFESYMNKIVRKINPEYVFEFVGYERDDPSSIADLDEKECRTWKSINEKRAEKGLDPIDLGEIKNGADIPMNVQLVQLLQAAQAQAGGDGMGGMNGAEQGEAGGDENAWEDYEESAENGGENTETEENNSDGENKEESAESENERETDNGQDFGQTEDNGGDFGKSLRKSFVMI